MVGVDWLLGLDLRALGRAGGFVRAVTGLG